MAPTPVELPGASWLVNPPGPADGHKNVKACPIALFVILFWIFVGKVDTTVRLTGLSAVPSALRSTFTDAAQAPSVPRSPHAQPATRQRRRNLHTRPLREIIISSTQELASYDRMLRAPPTGSRIRALAEAPDAHLYPERPGKANDAGGVKRH